VIRRHAIAVSGLLVACVSAGSPRPESSSGPTSPAYERGKSRRSGTVEAGQAPIATPSCVLHAGDIHTETLRERGPGGQPCPSTRKTSCYMNAECITERGVVTPSDALVEVECNGHQCVCRWELLGDPGRTREFAFEAECESTTQADHLLRDRCIVDVRSNARM
jgi:hypothetical protein